MQNGIAAEFRVDKETFEELMKLVRKLNYRELVGGNSVTSANRAAIEGCDVRLVSPTVTRAAPQLSERMTYLPRLYENTDIHLAILYREGLEWGNFKAYRSNRFYANYDTANLDLAFYDYVTDEVLKDISVFTLGGL